MKRWFILAGLLVSLCSLASGVAAAVGEAWEEDCSQRFESLYFDVLTHTDTPEDAGFMIQSKASQALHVFMILDMEIQNGGIAQFFWNCGSPYASRVAESLEELGLEDVKRLYNDFLSECGITMDEIDGYRARFPEFVGVYDAHPFQKFDDAYMAIWNETNLNCRVLDYARRHPEARLGQ